MGNKNKRKKVDRSRQFSAESNSSANAEVVAIGSPSNTPETGDIFADDINKSLSGVNGLKEFRKMRTDDKISAFLTLVKRVLMKPKWYAASSEKDSNPATLNAEFLKECMNDLDHGFSGLIEEAITMVVYGFCFFEIIYKVRGGVLEKDPTKKSKYSDGKVGWRDFGIRDSISLLEGGWIFDEMKNLVGVTQSLDDKIVPLMLDRSLLISLDSEFRNPQGQSMLYGAYDNWDFKRKIRSLMAIGIERDLAGLPVIYAPASHFENNDTSRAKLQSMRAAVSSIRRNSAEGLVFPSNRDEKGHLKTEIKLLSSGGSRQFNIKDTIEYLDVGILTSLLADFMAVGHGNSGSFSLHSDKTDMFLLSLEAILNKVRDSLNNIEIPRLFGYNGISEYIPTVQYEPIKKEDLTTLIENISKLSGAGLDIFPDDAIADKLKEKLDLPITTEK